MPVIKRDMMIPSIRDMLQSSNHHSHESIGGTVVKWQPYRLLWHISALTVLKQGICSYMHPEIAIANGPTGESHRHGVTGSNPQTPCHWTL